MARARVMPGIDRFSGDADADTNSVAAAHLGGY